MASGSKPQRRAPARSRGPNRRPARPPSDAAKPRRAAGKDKAAKGGGAGKPAPAAGKSASKSGNKPGKSGKRSGGTPRQRTQTVLARLDKTFGEIRPMEAPTVLEKAAYLVLREGSTHRAALDALAALTASFVDWNEVRASRPSELARMIAGGGRPAAVRKLLDRAKRLRDFLDQVYGERNEPSMEFVLEQKAKDRYDYLSELDGFGAHNAAALVQWLSGEDKLGPVTPSFAKAAHKLGLADSASAQRVRKDLATIVEKDRLVALQAHVTQLGEMEEPWPAAFSDLLA